MDLGLEPIKLVGKVPLFQKLASARLKEIVALLEPRLVIPGEKIIVKGDWGDAMFFIASGSVNVLLDTQPVQLGSGDFFGEMALVNRQPRIADVVAASFCDLLVLTTDDFQKLLAADPEAKVAIERAAHERMRGGR